MVALPSVLNEKVTGSDLLSGFLGEPNPMRLGESKSALVSDDLQSESAAMVATKPTPPPPTKPAPSAPAGDAQTRLACETGKATPKTDALCKDLAYLRSDAVFVQGKIVEVKGKIDEACAKIKRVIDTCDRIVKIRDVSCRGDPVLQVAAKVPVGFVMVPVGRIQPINKRICSVSKKAAKCKQVIERIMLEEALKKCPKLQTYVYKAAEKSSEAVAWCEDTDEIWCRCKTKNPDRAASVGAGCMAEPKMGNKPAYTPKCPKSDKWTCPLNGRVDISSRDFKYSNMKIYK